MLQNLRCIVLTAAALLLIAGPSQAGRINGSFSGRVTHSYHNVAFGAPWGYSTHFNGRGVTGTFSASDADCVPAFDFCLGRIELTFKVIGLEFSFGAHPRDYADAIFVQNTAEGQQLSLSAGFNSPYLNAHLDFNGPPNAFIEGTDFNTLHAGEIYPVGNTAYFMYGREIGASIDVTTISIDGVAIPEPASWLVLLMALATVRRHRPRRPSF